MRRAQVGASQDLQDVIIVGATVAGCTAAINARKLQLRTLVLDPASFPRPPRALEWIGPPAAELGRRCGLKAQGLPGSDFEGLCLRSWDFRRHKHATEATLCGRIVELGALEGALWELAERAGAAHMFAAEPAQLSLGEHCVVVGLRDGREVRGQVLLIADNADSRTAALARLTPAAEAEAVAPCAHVRLPGSAEVGVDVVIGARRTLQLARVLRGKTETDVWFLTRDTQTPAPAQFSEFLERAAAAAVIPPAAGATPEFSVCPAGVALELETHIGKRCALIGLAGGFVAAFSGETVYPGMASGWIAAEAVARAVRASVPQDELQTFGAAWRAELADFLRLPNTDLSLLMPLVLGNAQMSLRVARAFLLGRTF